MSNDPASSNSIEVESPGLGRALATGSAIGVVISMIAITGGILATGTEWGSAVGLGLFIAFWGGLGFGTMVSGVVWMTMEERREEAAKADRSNEVAAAV